MQFNAGDKIRAIRQMYQYDQDFMIEIGDLGVVLSSGDRPYVQWANGKMGEVYPNGIEKVDEPFDPAKYVQQRLMEVRMHGSRGMMDLNVGDEVSFNYDIKDKGIQMWDTGFVSDIITHTEPPAIVVSDKNGREIYRAAYDDDPQYASGIIAISKTNKEFNIGDRVRVDDPKLVEHDKTGIVVGFMYDHSVVSVKIDDTGDVQSLNADWIHNLTNPAGHDNSPRFKIGDFVKDISSWGTNEGIGQVVHYYTKHNSYLVQFERDERPIPMNDTDLAPYTPPKTVMTSDDLEELPDDPSDQELRFKRLDLDESILRKKINKKMINEQDSSPSIHVTIKDPAVTRKEQMEKLIVSDKINIRKTLDGKLILNHYLFSVIIDTEKLKILIVPKENQDSELTYGVANKMLNVLFLRGIIDKSSIKGSNVFNSLECKILDSEDVDSIQMAIFAIHSFIRQQEEEHNTVKEYFDELEQYITNDEKDVENNTGLGDIPQKTKAGGGKLNPAYASSRLNSVYQESRQRSSKNKSFLLDDPRKKQFKD